MPGSWPPWSLGCDDDARMAFHAEAAGDGPAVLRYAPRAARQAAELASHREAAAQFERALRFAADADPAVAAGLYDGLACELALLDRWQDALDAGERALALWRQAGDRLREGDTLRQLSGTLWRLCRGPDAVAAAEAAVAVLEPLGPSTELAWAYASLGRPRMLDGRARCGDRAGAAGAGDRRAAGRARGAQRRAQHRGLCSIADHGRQTGPARCAGRWRSRSPRACDAGGPRLREPPLHLLPISGGSPRRSGTSRTASPTATSTTSARSQPACGASEPAPWRRPGRWEEAVSLSTELLTGAGASPVNRINPLHQPRHVRATARRSRLLGCLDEAAAAADGSGEPQCLIPVRLARAEAYWLEGEPDRAAREAELADDVCGQRRRLGPRRGRRLAAAHRFAPAAAR